MRHVTAESIIELFGGLSSMSRILGINNPSLVYGWKKRDRIPHWRHDAILKAAKARKIKISREDLER